MDCGCSFGICQLSASLLRRVLFEPFGKAHEFAEWQDLQNLNQVVSPGHCALSPNRSKLGQTCLW